jgi:hypothetical protein
MLRFQLHPLTNQQIESFVSMQRTDIKERLRQMFEDERVFDMARTPLLLNLAARVCESEGSAGPAVAAGAAAAHICDRYIGEIFGRRPAAERANLPDIQRHVTWLARAMLRHNRFVFRVEDIQPQWLDTSAGRFAYALCSRTIAAVVFGASTLWAIGHSPLTKGGYQATPAIAMRLAIAGSLVTGVGYASVALLGWAGIRPFATHLRRAGLTAFVFAVAFGALITGMLGLNSHPSVLIMGIEYALLASVAMGFARPRDGRDIWIHDRRSWRIEVLRRRLPVLAIVVSGATIGLFVFGGPAAAAVTCAVTAAAGIVLAGSSSDAVPAEDHANCGIHATLTASLRAFLLVIALCTMAFGLAYGFPYGLAVGIALGTLAFLRFGGLDALYHYVLRVVLFAERTIGLNISRRLDAASETGLLRKVGGGYLFMHRLLLEHYAKGP